MLFSPGDARIPTSPSTAAWPRVGSNGKCRTATTLWQRKRRGADARGARHADLGQWPGCSSSAARSRSTTTTCSGRRRGREPARPPRLLTPYARHPSLRHAEDREHRHPARGSDRRSSATRAAGSSLRDCPRGRSRTTFDRDRRLARLHRQVLGRRRSSPIRQRPIARLSGAGPKLPSEHPSYQADLCATLSRSSRPGQSELAVAPVCRRQADGNSVEAYQNSRHPAVRPADRLGLVLLHHQAAVHAHGWRSTRSSTTSASPFSPSPSS